MTTNILIQEDAYQNPETMYLKEHHQLCKTHQHKHQLIKMNQIIENNEYNSHINFERNTLIILITLIR